MLKEASHVAPDLLLHSNKAKDTECTQTSFQVARTSFRVAAANLNENRIEPCVNLR